MYTETDYKMKLTRYTIKFQLYVDRYMRAVSAQSGVQLIIVGLVFHK